MQNISVPLQKEKQSSWIYELITKLTLAGFPFRNEYRTHSKRTQKISVKEGRGILRKGCV